MSGTPWDLLIVGAGRLGALVGQRWADRHPEALVVAETLTQAKHGRLEELGLSPRLRCEEATRHPFPFVLFCVPPTAADDYPAEAARAAQAWNREGTFLFTSSTGVYAEEAGGHVTETSPTAAEARAVTLLGAESAVRAAGGLVLRLAGLYDRERGPHVTYLRMPSSPLRPDGWINLIHYEDAADLTVRVLESRGRDALYLGCDGSPLTRDGLVEAAHAKASRLAVGEKPVRCRFTGENGTLGRRCDNAWTRDALGWQPRWQSFGAWIGSL